jgi:hypothetical protein
MRSGPRRPRRKYGNQPTGRFDSRREAAAYLRYCALQQATNPVFRVVKIERQVSFLLVPPQLDATSGRTIERAVNYIADFVVTYADDRREVVDVKSPITRKLPAYVIKRKLMLWRHGIRITEV